MLKTQGPMCFIGKCQHVLLPLVPECFQVWRSHHSQFPAAEVWWGCFKSDFVGLVFTLIIFSLFQVTETKLKQAQMGEEELGNNLVFM